MADDALTKAIIGCAIDVHKVLGPGYLESVYHQALAHELRKAGLAFESEHKLKVRYDGVVVGHFSADLLVQGCVLVELKVVAQLVFAHEMQLINYLMATGVDVGLLINFGQQRLEVKRKHRVYKARGS